MAKGGGCVVDTDCVCIELCLNLRSIWLVGAEVMTGTKKIIMTSNAFVLGIIVGGVGICLGVGADENVLDN